LESTPDLIICLQRFECQRTDPLFHFLYSGLFLRFGLEMVLKIFFF
jgi:hypothetical protein